ncbi:low specificity L-threonine aldolase [Lutibacter sp.]|uniref:threonine aldolase family protein n=1 Tax=Lutibacter sp. TaxID=1925666 RepID=UPI0027374F80|nr:beta-eliminating lyase-related protein [Lutibacter sp.]MDP3313273.1 beta-eliminating lyase-related protein [Lutibacter sp.]
MKRRNFVKLGGALAGSSLIPINAYSLGNGLNKETAGNQIDFIYDGIRLSPIEYTQLLLRLVDEGKVKTDDYSNGGVVEELEESFAKQLGKEAAVFMPTGTLANHIAVRELAKERRKIIVQEQSHLYNDSGDCCQTLSNLNLIPLGKDTANFTINEVEQVITKIQSGRVETHVGAIVIESPVRRKNDVMFGIDNIKTIASYAQKNNIKMHMDGARLFVEAAHTGVKPELYSQYFDTIYTSMYKCFNSPSGAILAGSKEFTENLFHTRRMFGAGLPASWPFAAIALHYADYFEHEYKKSWDNAQLFFEEVTADERFKLEKYENGTHMVRLNINHSNLKGFIAKLKEHNIFLTSPDDKGVTLKINPTINKEDPKELASVFIKCLNQTN